MTAFGLWLMWTLIAFCGGAYCGWQWSHEAVEYFQVEVMRRRLRIMQKAWDAERAIWHEQAAWHDRGQGWQRRGRR